MEFARHHGPRHGGHRHRGHHRGFFPGGRGYSHYYVEQPVYALPACPEVNAPVIGTDGKFYINECFARAAGQGVLRRLPAGSQPMYGAFGAGEPPGPLPPGTVSDSRKTLAIAGTVALSVGLIALSFYAWRWRVRQEARIYAHEFSRRGVHRRVNLKGRRS